MTSKSIADVGPNLEMILERCKAGAAKPAKVAPVTERATTEATDDPARIQHAFNACMKVEIPESENDATGRVIRYARQCVRAGVTEAGCVKVVRIVTAIHELPKSWTDDQIRTRYRQALECSDIGEAITPEAIVKEKAAKVDPLDLARQIYAASEIGGKPTIVYAAGALHIFDAIAGCYERLSSSQAEAYVLAAMNRLVTNIGTSHLSMVIKQLQMLSATNRPMPFWRNGRAWLPSDCFATQNEVLHLPSLVGGVDWLYSAPASADFVSTMATDYAFHRDNPGCPLWLGFIKSITQDPESRRALQMWAGYCLTPSIKQEKILFLIGKKRSGKGVFARVLTRLIGSRNVAGPTLAGLATNFGLSALVGRSLAIIGDARMSSRADQSVITERLLSLSSGDCLTIDRKYAEPLDMRLPLKLMILSNELPRLADASNALASRMLIVRTAKSYYGIEDTELEDRLLTELPGILHWAIEGWVMLRDAKRFTQPDSGQQDAAQIKRLSSPLSAFIEDECKLDTALSITTAELFKAWQRWCIEANHNPGSRETFGRDLVAAADVTRVRSSAPGRPWIYQGIAGAGIEDEEIADEPADLFCKRNSPEQDFCPVCPSSVLVLS